MIVELLIYLLLFHFVNSFPQELDVFVLVAFIVGGAGQNLSVGVNDKVARLGVLFVDGLFDITVFLAKHGDRVAVGILELALLVVGQRDDLVIGVHRADDDLLGEDAPHLGVNPDGILHVTAVGAAVAGEIQEHGLALLLGDAQGLVIVEVTLDTEGDMEFVGVQRLLIQLVGGVTTLGTHNVGDVEVLGGHWRQPAGDGLQRGTEHAGNHIDDKGEDKQGEGEAEPAFLHRVFVVKWESDLAQQVKA